MPGRSPDATWCASIRTRAAATRWPGSSPCSAPTRRVRRRGRRLTAIGEAGGRPFDAALVVRGTAGDRLSAGLVDRLRARLDARHRARRVGRVRGRGRAARAAARGAVVAAGLVGALVAAIEGHRRRCRRSRRRGGTRRRRRRSCSIVDDNVVNRRVAHHQLARLGYRVIEAENGQRGRGPGRGVVAGGRPHGHRDAGDGRLRGDPPAA